MRKNIVLWGYYGTNYGDDIMLEVLLNYFKQKKVNLFLVDMYDGTLNYKYKDYKNITIVPFIKYSRKEKLNFIRGICSKSLVNFWGGGTVFTDSDGDGNFKWFSLIKFFGGKIGYIGVGIGKLTNKKRIFRTKKLLKWSSITIFREEQSFKKANELVQGRNFYIADDLSYIFLNEYRHPSDKKNTKYILITWRNLVGYFSLEDEIEKMEKLVSVVESISKKDNIKKIILGALDTTFDVNSCRILYKIFEKKGIKVDFEIDSSIENITNLIGGAYIHFSGRLHGSVVSEFLHVPTVSLSYSPKINYFYESINASNVIDLYNEEINEINVDNKLKLSNLRINFNQQIENSKGNLSVLDDFFNSLN